MTAEKAWFGKHKGKELTEIPSGYLEWMVQNFDPVPIWKDVVGKSAEEAQALEDRMHNFLLAASKELTKRDES